MTITESVNRVMPPTCGKDTDSSRKFSGRYYCCGVIIVVVEQDTSVNSVAIKRQSVMVVERLVTCYERVVTSCPVSVERQYKAIPLPDSRIEDLFAKLSGGKSFTTLDLS